MDDGELTPADERRATDAAMAFARDHDCLSWKQISVKFDVPERTAHRRVKAFRAASKATAMVASPAASQGPITQPSALFEMDGLAQVAGLIDTYDRSIARIEAIAETASHDGIRLAANTRLVGMASDRVALLRGLNVIPRQLGYWSARDDLARILGVVQDLFERFDMPDEAVHELLASLDGSHSTSAAAASGAEL